MKKIYLFLVVSLMLPIANAAPNYWKTSYEQGVAGYSLTNHEGNSISIECNDAGFAEMDHGVSVYLKDNSMPLKSDGGDEVLIEFVIDGTVYNVPAETFSRRGSSEWMSLVEAISEANAFEVFWDGEYIGDFSSKNTHAIGTLRECGSMAENSYFAPPNTATKNAVNVSEIDDQSYRDSGIFSVGPITDHQIELEIEDIKPLNPEGMPLSEKRVSLPGVEDLTMGQLDSYQLSVAIQYLEYRISSLSGYEGLPDISGGPKDQAIKEAELLKKEMADLKRQYAITLEKEKMSSRAQEGTEDLIAYEPLDAEDVSIAINKYANSFNICLESNSPHRGAFFEFTMNSNLVSQKLIQAGLIVKKVESVQEKGSSGFSFTRKSESWVYSELFNKNYNSHRLDSNINAICDKKGRYKVEQIISVSPIVEATSFRPAYVDVLFTVGLLNLIDKQGIFYELQKFLNNPQSISTHVSTFTMDHGYLLPFPFVDSGVFYQKVYITDQGYVTEKIYDDGY